MQKSSDTVVRHAHYDIEIDDERPYLGGQVNRILPPGIVHLIATSAGTGLVEKPKPFYDRCDLDTDTFFLVFLRAFNVRQVTATLAAIVGLDALNLIGSYRHFAGIAFMTRLTAGLLPAFLSQ